VLNLETRETDARRASEKAEQQLASGVKATKEETVMISGNASMPNPKSTDYEPSTFDPQRQETWGLDGPVVGNTGGGFVRITLIG
jgi:hypothetical protein